MMDSENQAASQQSGDQSQAAGFPVAEVSQAQSQGLDENRDVSHMAHQWTQEDSIGALPNLLSFQDSEDTARIASDARQGLLLVSWGAIMLDLHSAVGPVLNMMQGNALENHRNTTMTEDELRAGLTRSIVQYKKYSEQPDGTKRDPDVERSLLTTMVGAVAACGLMPDDLNGSSGALAVLTDTNVSRHTVPRTCITTDFYELLGI